jgi:rod shape-determining protein MreD
MLVATSLVLALLLQIYPLRGELALWRPPFPLLVVLYWVLAAPALFGVGLAWSVGLLADLLLDGIPGQSALAYGLCAYMVRSLDQRLQYLSLIHLAGVTGLLVLLYQLVVVSIELLLRGDLTVNPLLFASALSATALWPFIAMALGALHDPYW